MEKIKVNPHIPLAAIRQCVDEEFGLKVGRMKAYHARDSALEAVGGLLVTEAESYDLWKWFLAYLSKDHHIQENAPRYVFMSDQQKGLAKAILEDFPQSEHRFCVQHIYNNFKKRFIGENFKEILWEFAPSTTHEQYVERMDTLRIIYPQAHQYILGVAPKQKWVNAYFTSHVCCDVILNNICETFNSKISIARELAIITMLEEIRTSQMERIQIRGQCIKTYDHALLPVIKEIVDKLSRQLTGIPCTHAVATINKNENDVSGYVSHYYLRSTMSILYENVMYPINEMDNWPKTSDVGFELAPPRTKRQRGRPKKLRREEPQVRHHENGSESLRLTFVLRCRRCGQDDHNKRTCTNDPRVDAQTEVGQSSQPSEPPTTDSGDRAELSNLFQSQEGSSWEGPCM
ncbi:uncharacterized protein LOC121804202 [Salvia splendens]|uniref:uncharacterized protein LOC121804202 n=1 Tax=Salvia splendens TaxID=180675 RepID=UPI001C278F59|nr:uncharacterized protein LOC121804202 [Salvia splendens]